ncbi:MAG: hypothetical protein ABL907_12645 [Hyphomicrobium sp.]
MAEPSLKEEYKAHYLRELQRRTELMAAVNVPLSLIGIFGGALSLASLQLSWPFGLVQWLQIELGIVALVLLAIASINLVRSYFGYTVAYVPTPLSLEADKANLAAYYGATATPDEVEKEVLEHLFTTYAVCAEKNTTSNDLRSLYLHLANRSLVASIPFVFLFHAVGVGYNVATKSLPVTQSAAPQAIQSGTSK